MNAPSPATKHLTLALRALRPALFLVAAVLGWLCPAALTLRFAKS